MKTIQVPIVFQPKVRTHFPSFQKGEELEWQAWQWFSKETVKTSYMYLPVMWCPYYVTTCRYASVDREMAKLRSYVQTINMAGKFITTNIYDGWPISTNSNIVVFSGSGLPEHSIPIPLICDPHPDVRRDINDRKILLSMVCSTGTHPVREALYSYFYDKDDCIVTSAERDGHSVDFFREMMKRSTFALSPRGSGKTSFRMYEAFQYGCIPVYVSDKHWLPFSDVIDWDKAAVLWNCDGLDGLHDKLLKIVESGRDKEMRKYGAEIHDKYFTYDGCFRQMKRIIEKDFR
jgi:hypothetical protein